MKIDIFAKNIELNQPLRDFIEDKIGSLEKYLPGGTIDARVEVAKPSNHHKSGFVFYAEVNIKAGGNLFRSTADHNDLHVALIEVKDDLQSQLKKFKEKKKDLARKPKK